MVFLGLKLFSTRRRFPIRLQGQPASVCLSVFGSPRNHRHLFGTSTIGKSLGPPFSDAMPIPRHVYLYRRGLLDMLMHRRGRKQRHQLPRAQLRFLARPQIDRQSSISMIAFVEEVYHAQVVRSEGRLAAGIALVWRAEGS